jgi:Uma2 family endonuclease
MTTPTSLEPILKSEEDRLPPSDDPFYYGFRYVWVERDGKEELEQVPLTLEDVLHPHYEDHVNQNDTHFQLCNYLYNVLRWRAHHDPTTRVLHDVQINWGVEGMKDHCPDIALFVGVHTHFPRGIFKVADSGGRVALVIEVTSPNTRLLDVAGTTREKNKHRQYAIVGVPFYVVVDYARQREGEAMPIFAYRLMPGGGYALLEADDAGRVWLEPARMLLGPLDDWVAWYDEEGRAIEDYTEMVEARAEAEAQAEAEARARAEAEARLRELEAELRRLRGEHGE